MRREKTKPDQAGDGDAHLEEAIRQLTGTGRGSCTPEQWAGLCEQLRLQALYPKQYVAWRDHHQGKGKKRKLVRCEVLCASPRAAVVRKYLARLSDDELYGVFMDYIEGPDEPLVGR
jgi:hypothetical protein